MTRTRVGFRGPVRSRARVEGFKGLGLGIGFRVWGLEGKEINN